MDKEKFAKLLRMMDEKNWVRMLVLFLPGIVIGKLCRTFNAPSYMDAAASVVLIVGGLIWLFWEKIKQKTLETEIEQGIGDDEKIAEIKAMCAAGENSDAAIGKSVKSGERESQSDEPLQRCVFHVTSQEHISHR